MPQIKHFYSKRRTIKYRGFNITVFPNVFVPRQISKFKGVSPKNISMYQNKTVLDMGTGTGIQGVIASESGAKSILAVDINPIACKNCTDNFVKYNIKNAEVRESDLFEKVPEKFDSIVAYLPSIDGPALTMTDRAIYDPEYYTFRNFLKRAKEHLNPGGNIYACWVNIDNSISRFYSMLNEYEYKIINQRVLYLGKEEWYMFDIIPLQ